VENKKNKWFNQICCRAIEKGHMVRKNYNRSGDQIDRKHEKGLKTKRVLLRENIFYEWNISRSRKG